MSIRYNSLIKKVMIALLAVPLVFCALVGYTLYREEVHRDCGLSVEQARSKSERFLVLKGLPIKYLEGPTHNDGSCRYDFHYNGAGEEYSFIILSTWLHGVKLTFWDHSRGEGP
jgi:hypothetical protein